MADALYIPSWAAGDSSGYKEQVLERAPSILDAVDAPLLKQSQKLSAKQYQVDWITDALASITLPTPKVFDAEPSYTFDNNRARPTNVVQEVYETFRVSESAQIISRKGGVAGVKDEARHELMKRVKELMKKVERILLSEQAAALDDDSTGASMGGFFDKCDNTDDQDLEATTGNAFYAAIGENDFQDRVVDLFDAGIEGELTCLAPSRFLVHVSRNYQGRVDVRREISTGDNKTVQVKVEHYQAPVGGLVSLKPNRSMGEGVALIAKEYCAVAELRGVTVKRTDKDLQHTRGFVNWYGTLVLLNAAACDGWKSDSTPDAGE